MIRLALAALAALLLAAAPAAAINNGTLDGHGHPAVGAFLVHEDPLDPTSRFVPGCGVALIAPAVALTAAHCVIARRDFVGEGPEDVRVTFDPDGASQQGLIAVTDWVVHPEADIFRYSHMNDVAVLFLAEPQAATPYELPAENALDGMDLNGVSFELVGYGSTANPQGTGKPGVIFYDVRQVATAPFQSLTQTFLKLLENTKNTGEGGACYSDSGSPVLLPGGDTVYAVTTGGNHNCRSTAQKTRIDVPVVRDWLLQFAQ
jgi:secreted trypsin-like serine protease